MNKGITLHFNSRNSSSVKIPTALNGLTRAENCSTAEHREEAVRSTLANTEDSGYPSPWLSTALDRSIRKLEDPGQTKDHVKLLSRLDFRP